MYELGEGRDLDLRAVLYRRHVAKAGTTDRALSVRFWILPAHSRG